MSNVASKTTSVVENSNGIYAIYTKEDLIKALDGGTDISTEIANQLRSGEININVLGDELFEAVCPKDCIDAPAYFLKGQIF